MDTDTDAIRVHIPNGDSMNCPGRYVESAQVFRDTLSLDEQAASAAISRAVDMADGGSGLRPCMRRLV